jgi:hypothetical protein
MVSLETFIAVWVEVFAISTLDSLSAGSLSAMAGVKLAL